jgi:hypothetical protein
MSNKRKDTLITKTKTNNNDSNKPSNELLGLIELVNEMLLKKPSLTYSRVIAEKLYTDGITTISSEENGGYFNKKIIISSNSRAMASEKESDTNGMVLEEIKRITKELPKLHNFIFNEKQNLYPDTNKKYVRYSRGTPEKKVEGIIYKYDDILRFATNLAGLAVITSTHINNEFGLDHLNQMELTPNYLDMPSSRLYIEKGKFNFELDLFAHHLQDLEAYRVRHCFVCKSVFWAYDLRSKYCSRKCSNRLSQTKWISNPDNKNKFLQKKKLGYQAKKAELEKEKQNKKNLIEKGKKKLLEEKDEQRRLNDYKSKKIDICFECKYPLKTCECKEFGKKIKSRQ